MINTLQNIMNRLFLFSIAALLLCIDLSAISERGHHSSGGYKLSLIPAIANMSLPETPSFAFTKKSRFGIGGGFGYETNLFSIVNLEWDIFLSPGGCVVDANPLKFTLSGYALSVPVLIKFRFQSGSSPTVFAGGQFGYIFAQKYRIENKDTGDVVEEDVIGDINRFYFGMAFGAGYEVQMGSMTLVFEGHYHFGLSNLLKNPEQGQKAKTRSISLLIGFKI